MKANELRIGNWVLGRKNGEKTNHIQVESVDETGINIEVSGGYYVGDTEKDYDGYFEKSWFSGATIEPIPLTIDILEKCGFLWSVYHQAFHFGDSAMNEFYDLNECYPSGYQLSFFKKRELVGNPIFYLHQLQNLYYALTGQELIYNPTP